MDTVWTVDSRLRENIVDSPPASVKASVHSTRSSHRAALLEHLFAGEVMKHLWRSGDWRLEVLKPQLDDSGAGSAIGTVSSKCPRPCITPLGGIQFAAPARDRALTGPRHLRGEWFAEGQQPRNPAH